MKIRIMRETFSDGFGVYLYDEGQNEIAITEPLKLIKLTKEEALLNPQKPT